MPDKLIFVLMAFGAGLGLAIQGAINSGLARGLGSPIFAATVSFWVGGATLTAISLASGGFFAGLAQGRSLGLGWWIAGGLLGALFVSTMTIAIPRIGVAAVTAFMIAGQLLSATILDHFGLFGLPVQPISLLRVVGVMLLISGALLVRFF
ncbi:DMT family transporter [Chelatococcus sambhunathii]|uniref:DMT family transporter n=1 Tax=Chelatococcus sambhunathii TaxID=363953 RepID=A0ABU1DBK2_9HYPH|nr:DMT family transporter [Chelatococcus sambhunathii]MDR4305300.1 DMT family transporter [Chelatococcus sambhunathii]